MGSETRLVMDGEVATVVIDNPPVNALHPRVSNQLSEHFDAIAVNPSLRVVILTGAGDHFVGGGDLRYVQTLDRHRAERYVLGVQAMQDKIQQLPQPVIAAINGTALGGGCELAMACDIRIAEAQARLGQPEVSLGIIPGAGGTQRLPRLVPLGRAKRLLFTGEHITAEEAHAIGLVDEVVAEGAAVEAARTLAKRIAANAPLAVTAAKRAVDLGGQTSLVDGQRIEASLFATLMDSRDFTEGSEAFFDNRDAVFTGE